MPPNRGLIPGMGNIVDACLLRPEQVKMDWAAEGFVGELSEIMSKVFDGIHNLDQNGVLGDPRRQRLKREKYLQDIIEYLYQWVGDQG